MASTPTKNPIPSENYDDLRFNAGKLDEFVTSPENSYTDRLGITHLTARGLQNSVAVALLPANNLSDVSDKDTSLANLGGGTAGIAAFKAGTPSAVRGAIAAAASGVNNDITNLTGLTTALSVNQGGTGNSAGRSATATKLDVPRGLRVNLASTSAVNFDGSADVTPGVTGTLSRSNGGTGQSDVSYLRAESATPVSLASTVFTKLSPTSILDTKSAYASGTWTCPAAGYYHVTGMVRFSGAGTGNIKALLKLDSSSSASVSYVPGQTVGVSFNAASGEGEAILNLSCILYLTLGSSYSLYAYHNHSAALSTSQQSLQIIRVA